MPEGKFKLLLNDPKLFFRKTINKIKFTLGVPNAEANIFITHNNKVWGKYKNPDSTSIILFDYYPLAETELVRSYLLNILAKRFDAKIVSYSTNNIIRSKVWDKIYKSYNVEDHLFVQLSRKQKKESNLIYEEVVSTIQTKEDLFNLHISDVWIGIDVYEEYLMRYTKPTVDLNDNRLMSILDEAIQMLVFFIDYFKKNNVKGIDSSHIGVRLKSNLVPKIAGQLFNIPYYTSHARSIVYYPEPHLYYEQEGIRFSSYHKNFLKLSEKEQSDAIAWSKSRLNKRLSGEVGVDMSYSTKSAFTKISNEKPIVKNPNKVNVLICTHEFYDAPNCYGGLLFMDFYEWLLYLADITTKTDFDWYMKTHPDVTPATEKIIKEFVDQNPKFNLIPAETSFHQLANEGIGYVLTCHGTVGHEAPLLGIKVINAGNNPQMAYDFNYHPKSIKEYENTILNLSLQDDEVCINDVYEFYYQNYKGMGMISDDWFFQSYENMFSDLKESERINFGIFPYFLEELTEVRHDNIISTMNKFLESGKVGPATKYDII